MSIRLNLLHIHKPSGVHQIANAVGVPSAQEGSFVPVPGPQGPQGEAGICPVLHIGTVTTLPAGSAATAELTGTASDPVLNLGIPAGDTGPQGAAPVRGVDYDTSADRQAIVTAVLAALPEYHGEVE